MNQLYWEDLYLIKVYYTLSHLDLTSDNSLIISSYVVIDNVFI